MEKVFNIAIVIFIKDISDNMILTFEKFNKCQVILDITTNRVKETFATIISESSTMEKEDYERFKNDVAHIINIHINNKTELMVEIANKIKTIALKFNKCLEDISIVNKEEIEHINEELDALNQKITFFQSF